MRIARLWPQVEALGLDGEELTLSKLRWVFSDSEGPPHGSKRASTGTDAGSDGGGGRTPATRS
jgi:hypothetical protein